MAQNHTELVGAMFQKCAERGWIRELTPSTITEEEIADFEKKYEIKLPEFYKAFLTAYQLPPHQGRGDLCIINGIARSGGEITPLWLFLDRISSISDLHGAMEMFRETAKEYGASADQCKNLIPIGDWGGGWGPLCIDLARDENAVEEDNELTWSLVWFDHEYMDWPEYYLGKDGLLHGEEAAPDLQTLLNWYFCGSLEPEFEEENQVKVSYERLNNREFCTSYWEDTWKEQS